jgi:hypothetical protein
MEAEPLGTHGEKGCVFSLAHARGLKIKRRRRGGNRTGRVTVTQALLSSWGRERGWGLVTVTRAQSVHAIEDPLSSSEAQWGGVVPWAHDGIKADAPVLVPTRGWGLASRPRLLGKSTCSSAVQICDNGHVSLMQPEKNGGSTENKMKKTQVNQKTGPGGGSGPAWPPLWGLHWAPR